MDRPTITPDVNKSRQFASTPKFVLSDPTIGHSQGYPPQQSSRTFSTPALQDSQLEIYFDTIDDASQSLIGDDDDPGLSIYSIENEEDDLPSDPERPSAPATKRRKFSEDEPPMSTSPNHLRNPAAESIRTAHRFITSLPRTAADAKVHDAVVVSKRQAFLHSSSPVDGHQNEDPLPIHFSPHRKGQKFETGGLAATMRSHIMAITTSGSHHLSHRGDDQWNFEVHEIEPSAAFTLARGTIGDGNEDNFILAGPRMSPKAADIIQVQGITWRLKIGTQQWIVCIDWKMVK
jgi:hypothetical protein